MAADSGGVRVRGFEKVREARESSCLFAGDWASIRLHAGMAARDPAEVYGAALFERIRSADFAAVNLESALGGDEPLLKDGPCLQGPPESAAALKGAGFDLATLANNHIFDYGVEGLRATLETCKAAGLAVCGAGMDLAEAMRPEVVEFDGWKLGVLSLCDLEEGAADWDRPGTALIHHPQMRDFVRAAREAVDALVLVVHGGREYVPVPPPYWRDAVLAAGREADLVVGHHPHVPQGMTLLERADGVRVPVVFSTGNFLFRPADPAPGWIPPRTADGYVVEAGFTAGALSRLDLVPYRIEQERGPRLLEESEAFQHFLEATSAALVDRSSVADWFDAVADHFWAVQVRERVGGLTAKACEGEREAIRHALSHHLSPAHSTLIHRAMERELHQTAGTGPGKIREQLRGWFDGSWPELGDGFSLQT
ncbi:MAG: CapA family protein [Opitutales bacterium]